MPDVRARGASPSAGRSRVYDRDTIVGTIVVLGPLAEVAAIHQEEDAFRPGEPEATRFLA